MTADDLRVVPLDARLLGTWAALFERASCPCYCRYWHFEGHKNDWLARCAFEPERSLEEQSALVRDEDPAGGGLVAMLGEDAVGWMKLAPRRALPRLRGLPVYRALDLGADEGVWSVGCFLVDPAHRRRGVARALVAGAEGYVRARGGQALEAYPRRAEAPIHDEERWMGPLEVFVEAGYATVHDDGPYPVLRRRLGT